MSTQSHHITISLIERELVRIEAEIEKRQKEISDLKNGVLELKDTHQMLITLNKGIR
jgi:cell division protein FtsL